MIADDLSIIDPPPFGSVDLGDGDATHRVTIRPLKVKQLPSFAAAVAPVAEQVSRMIGEGISAAGVLKLLAEQTEHVVAALSCATGATPEQVGEATIEQLAELLLAVLNANRDFLRGRLLSALTTAATELGGAGRTPSNP